MARARNIKPGFFLNEDLGSCDPLVRLLFIGIWTLADRAGRLEDRPKRIKVELFPYDDFDVNGALTVIERLDFIHRFSIENKKIIQIKNWHKHQRPHHTERPSSLPDEMGLYEHLTVKSPLLDGENPPDSLIPYKELKETKSFNKDLVKKLEISSPAVDKNLDLGQNLQGTLDTNDSNIEKSKKDKKCTTRKEFKCPFAEILDLYHSILPELPVVLKLTAARKSVLESRWKNDLISIEAWANYFKYIRQSKFLMGNATPTPGRKKFIASFDWIIKESNLVKISEGSYHGD